MRATVLAAADGVGLARASSWCPGSTLGEREGISEPQASPAEPVWPRAMQGPQQLTAATSPTAAAPEHPHSDGRAVTDTRGRSSPLPKTSAAGRAWHVAVGADGLLKDGTAPAASQPVAKLLRRVLDDGHELSEPEMVALFQTRGRDMEVGLASHQCCACRRRSDVGVTLTCAFLLRLFELLQTSCGTACVGMPCLM